MGIGSSLADVEAAYGSRRVASRTSATTFVAGNPDDSMGIVFELADGAVAAISLGR